MRKKAVGGVSTLELCHKLGFRIVDVQRETGKTANTIRNWHAESPDLLTDVLVGMKIKAMSKGAGWREETTAEMVSNYVSIMEMMDTLS